MNKNTLDCAFFPELGIPYRGKVREVYDVGNYCVIIASDRISAFDCILPEKIEGKGAILTGLSTFWFDATKDIVPNHLISHPDPNVIIVKKCHPLRVEVIVRGFLVGSLWRDYREGKREKCGVRLPEGLKENDPLPEKILTPTTKSLQGHDEDIVAEEIIRKGFATESQWKNIEKVSFKLFERGQEIAKNKGLILIDTKYEFGWDSQGCLTLIDEIHTPDSSRFWFSRDCEKKEFRFPDKEFLRSWLRSRGFTGHGKPPSLTPEVYESIVKGYEDVYRIITGQEFKRETRCISDRVLHNLKKDKLISEWL